MAVSDGVLSSDRIRVNLDRYLDDVGPDKRYTSFDYCFNYFQSSREAGFAGSIDDKSHIELSCLSLGFYLASWGMYRGKAQLSQRSARGLVPTIESIAAADSKIWSVDVNNYDDEAIAVILEVANSLRGVIPGGHSDTLVTKVMLGVFGCVPAYDRFVRSGLGVRGLTAKSLRKIRSLYETNATLIDDSRLQTIDFASGEPSERRYTRAKVIDMIYFIEGQ